jgi:hypothetical protein
MIWCLDDDVPLSDDALDLVDGLITDVRNLLEDVIQDLSEKELTDLPLMFIEIDLNLRSLIHLLLPLPPQFSTHQTSLYSQLLSLAEVSTTMSSLVTHFNLENSNSIIGSIGRALEWISQTLISRLPSHPTE